MELQNSWKQNNPEKLARRGKPHVQQSKTPVAPEYCGRETVVPGGPPPKSKYSLVTDGGGAVRKVKSTSRE